MDHKIKLASNQKVLIEPTYQSPHKEAKFSCYEQGTKNRKNRPIFRLSAGVEKKNPWKNRLKKFRRKIADFSEKIGKIPTFSRFFGVWRARASGGDFLADFLAIN